MSFEQKVNTALQRTPRLKRMIKRLYQLGMYAISNKKIKSEGNLNRISPNDEFEYFFGYYDKSPWDADDRYIIATKVQKAYKTVAPTEAAELVLLDSKNKYRSQKIAETHAWNVQQGCMAQWLGSDFKKRIIYNDFRDGGYCSVVFNVETMTEERVYGQAVYDVAKDGSYALSLDFSRLHRLRPGYGYSNLEDSSKEEYCPDATAIWKIDLRSGNILALKKYTDFLGFEPDDSMRGAEHKVNHLMISPDGRRFMVLHRWFDKGRKHTRLVTLNSDGSEMYNLGDDVFVSHCYWKNNDEILGFLRKKREGDHYYLMHDRTPEYRLLWQKLNTDGHCSYSPDGKQVITDTYPNNKRIAAVYICNEIGNFQRIARVFAPFKYDNDVRCDLHPRWNRAGDMVCIDSVHEGRRSMYALNVANYCSEEDTNTDFSVSAIIPTHNRKELLVRAVNSALKQTFPVDNVIVVSDGSDDGTDEMMSKWSEREQRIRYISYSPNKGGNFARNLGAQAATTRFIAFLDDDDEWHSDKIEKQIELFKSDRNLGLVCTAVNRIYTAEHTKSIYIPPAVYDCKQTILLGNCIGSTTTVMMKRELFEQAERFDENMPALQDYDMWTRFCQIAKVAVVPTACVEYYNYPNTNQISSNTYKYIEAIERINEKYKTLISGLTGSEQRERECYFHMLVSKKGIRNGELRIAVKYGGKAFICKPCLQSFACLLAAFVPYKSLIFVRKMITKRRANGN
jgi:glycosyltransferase involved in cell wall biosynthesis